MYLRAEGARASVLFALAALTVLAAPAFAHHSFAMFDRGRKLELRGTVKKYEWTNPHIWIDLVVEASAGEQLWGIEGGSPAALTHAGFSKNALSPGMKVTVTINPLKNGAHGGSLLAVVLPDGRTLDARTEALPSNVAVPATQPGLK